MMHDEDLDEMVSNFDLDITKGPVESREENFQEQLSDSGLSDQEQEFIKKYPGFSYHKHQRGSFRSRSSHAHYANTSLAQNQHQPPPHESYVTQTPMPQAPTSVVINASQAQRVPEFPANTPTYYQHNQQQHMAPDPPVTAYYPSGFDPIQQYQLPSQSQVYNQACPPNVIDPRSSYQQNYTQFVAQQHHSIPYMHQQQHAAEQHINIPVDMPNPIYRSQKVPSGYDIPAYSAGPPPPTIPPSQKVQTTGLIEKSMQKMAINDVSLDDEEKRWDERWDKDETTENEGEETDTDFEHEQLAGESILSPPTKLEEVVVIPQKPPIPIPIQLPSSNLANSSSAHSSSIILENNSSRSSSPLSQVPIMKVDNNKIPPINSLNGLVHSQRKLSRDGRGNSFHSSDDSCCSKNSSYARDQKPRI